MVKRIIGIFLLTALLGQADQALSVRTLAMEDGEMPVWYVAVEDEQYEALSWPTSQPSTVTKTQAGAELQLFAKGVNEAGEAEFKAAKKVAIPKAAKEVLLIASPGGEAEDVEVHAFADLFQQASFNDWLVINQSDQSVSIHYGSDNEPIELEAGEAGIYKVKTEADKGGEVIAKAMRKDEMKTMYSTFWAAAAEQRSLVLFYSEDERVKLRRIIDFLPVEKKATQ